MLEENIPLINLNTLEKFWIEMFDCIHPNGYNKTSGGCANSIVSDDTRAKHSVISSGKNNPFYGKHHTVESKSKISAKNLGKPGWNKGVPMSDEQKAKHSERMMGEKNPMYGKPSPNKGKTPWNKGLKTGKPSWNSGKKFPEMSARMSGENNPMYGKSHSEESRKKMSISRLGNKNAAGNKGKPCSEERRKNISEAHQAKRKEKILQLMLFIAETGI